MHFYRDRDQILENFLRENCDNQTEKMPRGILWKVISTLNTKNAAPFCFDAPSLPPVLLT